MNEQQKDELHNELVERDAIEEIKELKGDDTKTYPKVPFKLVWDNDIREDRTSGWN